MPTYPEIRLAVNARGRLPALIEAFDPDAIHIPTEGPLGWAARRWCLRHGRPFTTSFHTLFPEYVHLRFRIPLRSEEHTSELQSLMRISYAVFCLKKKK